MKTEIEITGIEHLELTDPEDWVSRAARYKDRTRDMASNLELTREREPKSAPRIPRNTEPAPLWLAVILFSGLVLGWLITIVVGFVVGFAAIGGAFWVLCVAMGRMDLFDAVVAFIRGVM